MLQHLLLSAAIGDICGSVYERRRYATKRYADVDLFHPYSRFTDDTVCTFACAEALLNGLDMAASLRMWCLQYPKAGYGGGFMVWFNNPEAKAYGSYGNGAAMRCSSAGWLATTHEECIEMATRTAMPTHNHPEGIKGAVATALTIFYLKTGHDKAFIKEKVLREYYPDWAETTYDEIHPHYHFRSSCQETVPPAILSFIKSESYADCITRAIALGGDADTLATIAGPMAYAHFRVIDAPLLELAKVVLPQSMWNLSEAFDERCQIL